MTKYLMADMGQQLCRVMTDPLDLNKRFTVIGYDINGPKEVSPCVYKFLPSNARTPNKISELVENVKVFYKQQTYCVVRSPFYDITLKQLISTGKHVSADPRVLCTMFFGKLIEQVAQLHANTISVGAISPSNLVVDDSGCIQLGDFSYCIQGEIEGDVLTLSKENKPVISGNIKGHPFEV